MATIHRFRRVDEMVLALFERARIFMFRPGLAEDRAVLMRELICRAIRLSGENPHEIRLKRMDGSQEREAKVG